MNEAQIHLALNHAPLFLSIIGGGILITGMIRQNDLLKTVSLWLLAAGAVFALPVYFTGDGTEELIEHLPGVNEGMIERHEEMAKISLIIIGITGLSSITGLLLRKKAAAKIILVVTVILSLASFFTMAQTAHLGGQVRHSEIQGNSTIGDKERGDSSEQDNDDD